jgi:hypothetical protein
LRDKVLAQPLDFAPLNQATQQARRQLEPVQPWLLVIRAVGVLAVFGAVWLNVRGQHPYQHPTAPLIPVVITFGLLNLVATVTVARRATTGVSGKSRLGRAEVAVLAALWIGVFAVMGAMAGAGVGLCVTLLGYAAVIVWQQHRSAIRS